MNTPRRYKITKRQWEERGGFKNSDLYRRQVNGIWYYYAGATR